MKRLFDWRPTVLADDKRRQTVELEPKKSLPKKHMVVFYGQNPHIVLRYILK